MVYEDDALLVVDKPMGIPTAAPDQRTRLDLFGLVKDHVRRRHGRKARAWIVHRLDMEASGLLVFAKSEEAFHWLKEDFRSKRVHRLYLAVLEGEMGPSAPGAPSAPAPPAEPGRGHPPVFAGTVHSYLREDQRGMVHSIPTHAYSGPGPRGAGPMEDDDPRPAVTHYRVVHAGRGRTLVQLRLETGRKHQIRVHMRDLGHPVTGDLKYGPGANPITRLALHAAELGFTHPATGQSMRFSSPAPAAFYALVGLEPPAGHAPRAESDDGGPIARTRPKRDTGEVRAEPDTAWDNVAEWYDSFQGQRGSDHFDEVILPGTLRLLRPARGQRILDLACGQGVLCRRLAELGVDAVGVDASEELVRMARERSPRSLRFEVGDARALGRDGADLGSFDSVACVMALMNIDPLEPVIRGVAGVLRPGGAFVGVVLHPGFRAPGQTSWGWDTRSDGSQAQYRRVDGYLTPSPRQIVMNPGEVAQGAKPVVTWTFHRPLQTYARLLADSGLLIEAIEEWPSHRRSEPGPRAKEENRARREIPMFLGFRALRVGEPVPIV